MIPDRDDLDGDDYAEMKWIDQKESDGWTRCSECKEWIHRDDRKEGAKCSCDDEEADA